MGRKYQLGARFGRVKYVCVGAEVLVLYCFHFIYQTLFPQWNQFALGVGFALLAAAAAFGTVKLLDWCAAHLWYQIRDDGLEVCRGGNVTLYPWEDFTEAGIDGLNIIARMPAWFKLKNGKRLELEQFIDGLGSLILDILAHIEGHAKVAPELRERLKTAQALQSRR